VKISENLSQSVADVSVNVASQNAPSHGDRSSQASSNQNVTPAVAPENAQKDATPCDIPRKPTPSPAPSAAEPPIEPPAENIYYRRIADARSKSERMRTLTPTQIQAVYLLASGHSDIAVGRSLSIHRSTVNRWRLYHPAFIARLNRLRHAAWHNTLDGLRVALPAAVAQLTNSLTSENPAHRHAAAVQLLKIAGTSRLAPKVGYDNTYEILLERRAREMKRFCTPHEVRHSSPPDDEELDAVCASLATAIEAPPDEEHLKPAAPQPASPTPTP
jgi:hypothetical protein